MRIRALLRILVITVSAACADEPTDPSRMDIAGTWRSRDTALFIYNIELRLFEPSPGKVVGGWWADGTVDNRCRRPAVCRDSSIVSGRNEVAQVYLELLGAGQFVGERPSENRLHGVVRAAGSNYRVTFDRQ